MNTLNARNQNRNARVHLFARRVHFHTECGEVGAHTCLGQHPDEHANLDQCTWANLEEIGYGE